MPNPIETDDALALALGRLAGRWGQVEFAVELIFIVLAEMPHRKATIAFSFHKSVAAQKDIIFFLADETSWITDEERGEVKAAIREFADKSGARNGWIHYPFGVDTSSPELEVYKTKRSRKGDVLYSKEPASGKIIGAFSEEVAELNQRLLRCHSLLMEAYSRKLAERPLRQIPITWSLLPQTTQGLLAEPPHRPQSSAE